MKTTKNAICGGPIQNPENCLTRAYTNSLDLAVLNDCKSIAFPAISCGAYGYPVQEAAEIAISICLKSKYENLAISFFYTTNQLLSVGLKLLKD
ncbi:macro domain-containing protein [Candidatus Spongiihabitans sp.]|uniref:macro domain-containing protein n=1 Tax=Candidatus Spongiihabitans sp. TaxID=3101308 RepID=UPI003C6EE24E